jgi:hypothetical protein
MKPQSSRQLLVLVALVVVALSVLWFRGDPTPTTGASATSNRGRGTSAAAATEGEVADVQLELLKAPQDALPPPERNPFRFQERQQPASARSAAPARPVVVAPPGPAGPPPPPPITLKFFGVLDLPNGTRVASLSDGRGNTFIGKEGDIIEGRYQILKIGTESIDVAYTDGAGRQTIRLSGQ